MMFEFRSNGRGDLKAKQELFPVEIVLIDILRDQALNRVFPVDNTHLVGDLKWASFCIGCLDSMLAGYITKHSP
jgi:hypothetical protein